MFNRIRSRKNDYVALRQAWSGIIEEFVSRLPRNVLDEALADLGMLKGKRIIFKSESEAAVLMDHALFDIRRGGQTIIQLLAKEHPAIGDSVQRAVLDAVTRARYAVMIFGRRIDEVTIEFHDLFRGEGGRLVDISFAESLSEGSVLAGRILEPREYDFWFQTGASLPLIPEARDSLVHRLENRFGTRLQVPVQLNEMEWSELATLCIRSLVRHKATESIRYADVETETSSARANRPFLSRRT